MYNRLKLSLVWNRDRWFFGASGNFNVAVVNEKKNYICRWRSQRRNSVRV